MLAQLQPTAKALATSEQFLKRLVGDFTEADWRVRDAQGHDARWIVGHIAALRLRMLVLLGLPAAAPAWAVHFGRGTRPDQVPQDLDLAAVLASFHATQDQLASHWEAVTAADLDRPAGRTFPDGSDTAGGGLGFLVWHETYHLGQLGLLRRQAGKPGVA